MILPETQRVQSQSSDEWKAELENGERSTSVPVASSKSDYKKPEKACSISREKLNLLGVDVRSYIDHKLLVKNRSLISKKQNDWIITNAVELMKIAEPIEIDQLFEYVEYRTFIGNNQNEFLAIVFRNLITGEIAERYFNIILKKKNGKYYEKAGKNGQFKIKGTIKRPVKGSFINFWLDIVGENIPDDRVSHIYRKMNTYLSGVVVSCIDAAPHNDIIKLKTLTFEGCAYDVPLDTAQI